MPALAQNPVFATNTCTVGSGPYSVSAADVNGDGKPDLICANYYDGTLTVLTNNGGGIFGSNATITVGYGPFALVSADANGDGRPDLICANYIANTLSVLTNNGSGGLGSNATLNVGAYPKSVTTADVNGDGKPDLICANYYDGTLTVLTNNGGGIFGSNATLAVGSRPDSVIAADVNGDGKPDLICANYNDGTLTVLTNNGGGIFNSNATLTVGGGPDSVIAVDLNGDGHLDLICANSGTFPDYGTLTVLTNDGTGVFGSNATLNVDAYPNCVVAADINGDGRLELISANSSDFPNPGTLTVWTNNGGGAFGLNATLGVGLVPYSVVAADLNGTGLLDLVSANAYDGTLTVLTQLITGPPKLAIAGTGLEVTVSWPLWLAGNFSLQTNADLTTTNWGDPGYSISTNGATRSISITPAGGSLFFRLSQ